MPNEYKNNTPLGGRFKITSLSCIAEGDPALPELLDVICCQCREQGKTYGNESCDCLKQHILFTSYCICLGGEDSEDHGNLYTICQVAPTGDEDDADLRNAQAEELEGGL